MPDAPLVWRRLGPVTFTRSTPAKLLLAAWLAGGAAACSGPTTPAQAAGTLGVESDSARRTPVVADTNTAPVLTMRNVQFRFTKDLVVGIDRIRADMRPVAPADVVSFDNPASFDLDVSGAAVRLTLAQAQVLMNTRVFSYPNANVRDVTLEADGQNLVIHGTLSKGATIPFTMVGTPSIRDARWLAVETKEVKIGAVGVTGLLNALHISLSAMINTPANGQVRVQGNTILIDVLSVLPPPHIHATIAALDCCARGVGLQLGSANAVSDSALRAIVPSAMASPNFLAIRRGRLRFGKLTMVDSDLDLVDEDSRDPFDFYLHEYQCQLAAGVAHATLQFGWRVRMPDFDKLSAEQCPSAFDPTR
jgi:hypothetical protein